MKPEVHPDGKPRCPWLPANRDLYRHYHDTEWGRPSHDAIHFFEMICLEGAQAGLSWWTVLRKRERYREVFHGFDPALVANMTDAALEEIAHDPGVIRHRGKIFSVRQNARAWLEISDPVDWLWSFVDHRVITHQPHTLKEYPTKSPNSDAMSNALRKAGFNFVGSTTMYAFMQAVGMVNNHSAECFLVQTHARD